MAPIGSDPGLQNVERKKGTFEPGGPNRRVERCEQCFLWEFFYLSQGMSSDQLGQDRSGGATDDTAIPTKPHRRDDSVHTEPQLHANTVATQGIDVFMGHIRRRKRAVITRMSKMLE
jgi:hypothetical protein